MIYEFVEEETGKRVEVEYSPARVPSIGRRIRRGGRTLRRLPSVSRPVARYGGAAGHWGVNHQLPKFWPHHKGRYRADGACIIDNVAQAKDNAKRGEAAGEPVVWDD